MEIQCLSCKTTLKELFCKCVCGKTFIQRGKVRTSCGIQDLSGEANKASTNTKASASAGGGANAGGIDVEDREGGKRSEGDHADFRKLEDLARDHVGHNGNR